MKNEKYYQPLKGKGWIILVCILVFSLGLTGGCTKAAPKVYKVGILCGLSFFSGIADGFKAQMKEIGYVEGKNISYDQMQTDFDIAEYQSILKKFIANKVDCIFAFPTEAAIEAKKMVAGTNIPVVFSFAQIEGMGLANSILEPGNNTTGIRYPAPDIAAKRFEIIMELAPKIKKILIPYQIGYPSVPDQLAAIRSIADPAGVTVIEAPAANVQEVAALLKNQEKDGKAQIDGILTLSEPLSVVPDIFTELAKYAYTYKIPIGGTYMVVGDHATIFGILSDINTSGKLAAPLVDKIFKGIPAGTIPVLSADNYIQINLTAAEKTGITIPEAFLKMANEVNR